VVNFVCYADGRQAPVTRVDNSIFFEFITGVTKIAGLKESSKGSATAGERREGRAGKAEAYPGTAKYHPHKTSRLCDRTGMRSWD
jgi:hypothetical protein